MGAGTGWRPAGRSTAAARSGSSWRMKSCVLVLKKSRFSVRVATVGLLSILGLALICLPDHFSLDKFLFVSEENRAATVLIWTHPFGRYRELPDCFSLYQTSGCTITDDWSAYPQADAVIIHHREVANGKVELPPEPRPPAQKWIWMNHESPSHTPRLWHFEDVFNLTMSYRTDSDIFLPYGYLIPHGFRDRDLQHLQAQPLHVPFPSRSQHQRPRLVAWVISNWSESQARVAFYRQLRRYITVDVFGLGGRPLPEDSGRSSVLRLLRRYLFYLALENSQHTDYITEKLWNAILAGAVPVVLGPSRQNYERFLPPEAFIHVDDFPSVRALAQYLLMLRRNPARLRRHLDWRGSYSLHQPAFWSEHYCTACRAVKRSRASSAVVTDLTRWFYSELN
ncbi:alpha-(1,3)-fucosyltransferase 4-like [Anabas testudineus]|uniref:alpha-(1,3)-fucosyltransferase 4-like n=1 Tax=Anabas testudineus TaxID=64144 RepID=UPI000E45B758|nr:alpha-(1,3)-fucosyltransferase 4-like [Anabas testudineus]